MNGKVKLLYVRQVKVAVLAVLGVLPQLPAVVAKKDGQRGVGLAGLVERIEHHSEVRVRSGDGRAVAEAHVLGKILGHGVVPRRRARERLEPRRV